MPTAADNVRNLIDQIDSISERSSDEVRSFMASLDPVRLANPNDTEYDEYIRDSLRQILSDAMLDAHLAGREMGRNLLGGSSGGISLTGELPVTPRLDRQAAVAFIRLDGNLTRMGASLDTYLATAQAQGLAPEMVLDTIERSLLATSPTDIGIGSEIQAIYGDTIQRGITAASEAGQAEEQAHMSDPDVFEGEPEQIWDDINQTIAEQRVMWSCALVNTCPDCLPRHGQVRTRAEWDDAGRPGTPEFGSVCGTNCKCQLIPEESADDSVLEPVRIPSRTARRALRAAGSVNQPPEDS